MTTHRPSSPSRPWILAAIATILIVSAAGAKPKQEKAPAEPVPIVGQHYRLVKNWDFGKNVTSRPQLDAEFFTRYIYNDGKLDTLNDEWERYRDNDNHVFADGVLKLTARLTGGLKSYYHWQSGPANQNGVPGTVAGSICRIRMNWARICITD